jgi:hypothetical protein
LEDFVRKVLVLMAILSVNLLLISTLSYAQDDMDNGFNPNSEPSSIIPPSGNNAPTIIDESDSSSVSDVDDVDG